MDMIDLFALRASMDRQRILLCFNGPISRSLIEEIGTALKNYLQADSAQPSAAMDVFSVYIEMTQNIRHYALAQGYSEQESAATVIVAKEDESRYIIHAGNLVEAADASRLLAKVDELAPMDKTALKAAYKAQLRQPRNTDAVSGAGLGLIDIARKSAVPLAASLTPTENGRVFFSLRAVI